MLSEHGYSEQMLSQKIVNEAWISLMKDLLARTRPLFDRGLELCGLVSGRVRLDIELFSRGGIQILRAIENSGYDTLRHRPKLTRWTEGRLVLEALLRSLLPRSSNGLRRGRKAA
jgi:phytoene/squalene synthetase